MWNIEDAFDLLMPFTTGFTAFTFAAYILWHVASFAKRYICDDEYDAHEHSVLTRIFDRGEFTDGGDEFRLAVAFFLSCFVIPVILAFIIWAWPIPTFMLVFYGIMRTARGVVRLKKALYRHTSDPDAHKSQ